MVSGAELDLDVRDASGLSAALPSVETEPYNPERWHSLARRNIAYWLLAILSLLVVLTFIPLYWILFTGGDDRDFAPLMSILNIVFGPVVTLVGSATGFYFGAQSAIAKKTGV